MFRLTPSFRQDVYNDISIETCSCVRVCNSKRGVCPLCVYVCVCLCWWLCLPTKRNWFRHFKLIAFCAQKGTCTQNTHEHTPTLRNVGISWQALQSMVRTGFVQNRTPREIRSWVSKRLRAESYRYCGCMEFTIGLCEQS